MNLKEILELKYPEECAKGYIRCNSKDMVEWTIGTWEIEDPIPSNQELEQWESEYESDFITKEKQKQFRETNKDTLEALAAIDVKSIRALRENDQVRLAELNSQAIQLRKQFT